MSQFALLGQRRFGPFFLTQAFGAFNDNAFRYALIGMATFRFGMSSPELGGYNNLALALFILPFFLFSASAGQLAERMEKARLIRIVKAMEVAVMILAAVAFQRASPTLLLVALFLMGLQSTLFGPIKYSILPQVLRPGELTGGNGLVESGTSLAILLGSMAGNALMAVPHYGPQLTSAAVIGVALAGYAASRAIPSAPATAPDLRFEWNPLRETGKVLRDSLRERTVFHAILGISWFWFFGAVLTVQLPLYTRDFLGGDASVLTLALALFSIGIGAGSLLCERLSGGRIEPGLVPLGAMGMTLTGVDLYFTRPRAMPVQGQDAWNMLSASGGVHVAVDLVLIGLFAGFYIVPLFAMVQQRAPRRHLSRTIAATNIINALFMVLAAAFGSAALWAGLTVPQLFLAVALLNAVVVAWMMFRVPEFALRFIGWLLLHLRYRVRCSGLRALSADGPVLLLAPCLDTTRMLLVMTCLPRPVRFVLDAGLGLRGFCASLMVRAGAIVRDDLHHRVDRESTIARARDGGEVLCLVCTCGELTGSEGCAGSEQVREYAMRHGLPLYVLQLEEPLRGRYRLRARLELTLCQPRSA